MFLGDHDALAADSETLAFAVEEARAELSFGGNGTEKPLLFLFGSVGSF
ncbi:MAG: hypothetical protein R2860_16590 [Desulfobacterales bacterium]